MSGFWKKNKPMLNSHMPHMIFHDSNVKRGLRVILLSQLNKIRVSVSVSILVL